MTQTIIEEIKIKFNELISIYNENNDSTETLHIAQSSFNVNQTQLILTHEQVITKNQLVRLIISTNKLLTLSLANTLIDEFSYQVLENMHEKNNIFNNMIKQFKNLKLQEFTIIKPAIIHLTTTKPIQIIKLTLFSNPIQYLQNKYKETPQINNMITNHNAGMFINKDPYHPNMPDVAVMITLNEVDNVSAENNFIKYSQEALGFLKLFQPRSYFYFTTIKPNMPEHSLTISNHRISNCSGYSTGTTFNRGLIDDKNYELYLNMGLRWLNEDPDSDKSKKMRDALYWFNYATDEINLTNKFIYLITVLECLLKDSGETSEIMTTIAERTAFVLGGTKDIQISNFRNIKTIYGKRSKIIHNGATLVANDELMVLETYQIIRNIIIKLLKEFADSNITFKEFISTFLDKKFA